jgi:uncharacterized membrane protein
MDVPDPPQLPRGLRICLGLLIGFLATFVLTAPWHAAGREINRLSAPLGVAAGLGLLLLVPSTWRGSLVHLFRSRQRPLSRRTLLFASLTAAAFLARVLLGRYRSLELNAWDTTLFFDHPIAATLSGKLLYCDATEASYLGTHASYVLFAFVPLYAIAASPLWLLMTQSFAIAAGAAAGFLVFRRILDDDLGAAMLAAAFLFNAYTAKTVQYGFHPEALYPLAVFLLWLGVLANRPWLLGAGTLLAVGVKEDSLLVLLGFAFSASVFQKRYRVGAIVAAAGLAAFVLSTRLVMPSFSGASADRPWYASYWTSWGNSLPSATLAMATHPLQLGRTLLHSGIPHLLEPLLFLPLAGPEGLMAALPALVPFGAADFMQLQAFALYYAMPVLPFLFVGAVYGLRRITTTLPRRRALALLVLGVCAFDGGSYTFRQPSPALADIAPALASLGDRPVRIQGSLYPHAGYLASRRVLDKAHPIARSEAVLLDPETTPYPFTRAEMAALVSKLEADEGYQRSRTRGGLALFVARDRTGPGASLNRQ